MNNKYFNNAKFIGSYPSTEDLPVDQGSEIAFCGRSNCGKSSILNALTNNKKLAKTSKTPGRTQSITLNLRLSTYLVMDMQKYLKK